MNKLYQLRQPEFVGSLEKPFSVIPAEAGIQSFQLVSIRWIPVFTGMTTFYETINFGIWILVFKITQKGADIN